MHYALVCSARIDLAFLIDGSGSVGATNFRRCISFVRNIIRGFRISPRYTRVAAAVYSSAPRRLFSFTRFSNTYQVSRALASIRYPRGGTRTGKALWDVRNFLFRGRTKKKRVLAVITDGRSQDHVLKAAGALKRANVEIFAIGVGRGYSITQLNQIATDRSHVFTVDFRNLNSIINGIKKKTCRGRVCWIDTWIDVCLLSFTFFTDIFICFLTLMDLLFILRRPKTAITTQTVRYGSILCFCSYCPLWYRHCVSRLICFLLTYSVQGLFEPLLCTH